MKYNMGDSWDGFDAKQYVYDEHKEKNWSTGIWKILACIMLLVIIFIVKDHIDEIRYVNKGTMIEAEYDAEKGIARYWDDNGNLHIYDLSSYYVAADDSGILQMYYIGSLNYARPRNSLVSRLFFYFLFGGLLIISVWRIRKNS